MRLIFGILFLCFLIASFLFAFTVVTNPAKTYSFFATLGNPPSLEKNALIPFAPPKAAYKVSFPVNKPSELGEYMQYTRQSPLPSPQYFAADKDLGYYATAYETEMTVAPASVQQNKLYEVTGTALVTSVGANANAVTIYDPVMTQKFLDTKCDDIMRKVKGTITTRNAVSARGGVYPGRSIEGTFTETGNAYRMNFYLDQQHKKIFAVAVVGTPKRVFSAQATKFLNSLDIWS